MTDLPGSPGSRPRSGIDVVRNRIKTFAQKKVTLPLGRHKLVILDEADSMTSGAQQALRRTMEIYSNTTRFAFACNQSNKIIEPIQSRCAILRYSRLSDKELLKRLLEICEIEKVSWRQGRELVASGEWRSVGRGWWLILGPSPRPPPRRSSSTRRD